VIGIISCARIDTTVFVDPTRNLAARKREREAMALTAFVASEVLSRSRGTLFFLGAGGGPLTVAIRTRTEQAAAAPATDGHCGIRATERTPDVEGMLRRCIKHVPPGFSKEATPFL
jgi:hypothetical protein